MPEVFPAWDKLPKEAGPGDEVFGRRLRTVKALRSRTPPRFVVAPIQAFLQPVPTVEVLARSSRTAPGRRLEPGRGADRLAGREGDDPGRGGRGRRRVQPPRRHPRRLPARRLRPDPRRVLRRRGRVDPPVRRRDPALARQGRVGRPDRRPPLRRRRPLQLRPRRRRLPRRGLGRPGRAERPPRGGPPLPRPGRRPQGAVHGRIDLRQADQASVDRPLDPLGRLAGGDLPPPDRVDRAVLGRADQGQGGAGRGLGRRPGPDRLPQRGRGRAARARSSPRPRSPGRAGSN